MVVRSPNKADNTKHEQTVWEVCKEPVQGNPAVKRLLLGPNLLGIVGIAQVLRMLCLAAKDTERVAGPVMPSEKGAVAWLKAHGWTEVGQRNWRHPGARATLSPRLRF